MWLSNCIEIDSAFVVGTRIASGRDIRKQAGREAQSKQDASETQAKCKQEAGNKCHCETLTLS